MTRAVTDTRRIAILTGGGDVPGLNAVIKSVVYRATEVGYTALGIRRGWEGLTHLRPGAEPDPDYLRPLDRTNTRTIERTGGTILHTSRTNPRKMRAAGLPAWMPEAERAHHMLRLAREHVIGEEEVYKLIHNHGFSIANLSSRLSENGQQFEYRMTIKSRDRKNADVLSSYLRGRPEVVEFRITPTGD